MSKPDKKRAAKRPFKNRTVHVDGVVNNDEAADEVRLKYKYRKLVMTQGVKLPARLAMKMIGPDCAYHLYSQHKPHQ